jgi:hypothetical protein
VLSEEAPTVTEYVQTEQVVQPFLPATEYVPAGQSIQTSSFKFVPFSHEMQISLPDGKSSQAEQLMQVLGVVAPRVVEYVPVGHSWLVILPV